MSNSTKWRVSDAHGLCIVEDRDGGSLVAELEPTSDLVGWRGSRQQAELIVQRHNGWDALKQERDKLADQVAEQKKFCFATCCTCVGQQIDNESLGKLSPDHDLFIYTQDQYSYVCTYMRTYLPGREPQIPTCIYQDDNWYRDRVRNLLEPLNLWEPGRFGVWTLPR